MKGAVYISLLKALFKGFAVAYLLFLPILFNKKLITSEELGYIGALLIVGTFLSGLMLSYIPHKFKRITSMVISLSILVLSVCLLIFSTKPLVLSISFFLAGAASVIGQITVDEIAAHFSEKGKRFGSFANMAMYTDVLRIAYPVIFGAVYSVFGVDGFVAFLLIVILITGVLVFVFARKYDLNKAIVVEPVKQNPFKILKTNKPFTFVVTLEFFDGFSSSQLFVFLPTLLIFKNFSIESALGLQSILFMGYFIGRWLIGKVANKSSGYKALGLAEAGMVATIILLLALPSSFLIYILCFLLGIFARGTSPVIKAMIFDELEPNQTKQGAAVYGLIGDSGSALGQFLFGILLAWLGINAPFLVAAFAASVVIVGCGIKIFRK